MGFGKEHGMRSVSVDLEIHKKIEMERQSFEEDDNTVLRRLLKMPVNEAGVVQTEPDARQSSVAKTSGTRPWRGDHGVVLPHGTKVYMTYGRGTQEYHGLIADGWWSINGQRYKTPSGAASGCAKKADGTRPVLGGYKYWYVQMPGSKDWILLDTFRLSKKSAAIV